MTHRPLQLEPCPIQRGTQHASRTPAELVPQGPVCALGGRQTAAERREGDYPSVACANVRQESDGGTVVEAGVEANFVEEQDVRCFSPVGRMDPREDDR